MSQTFVHKGRRVDFDYWQLPELSDVGLDFQYLADMVKTASFPGVGQVYDWMTTPFLPDFSNRFSNILDIENSSLRWVVGAALATAGTAMLIPGPVDALVAYAGFMVGGPVGAVVAVVAYNVVAVVIIGVGLYLMSTA